MYGPVPEGRFSVPSGTGLLCHVLKYASPCSSPKEPAFLKGKFADPSVMALRRISLSVSLFCVYPVPEGRIFQPFSATAYQ